MPKQIDHEAYKIELAQKAAGLFSEYGYDGLGMRKIAAELGLSKSALYHYFPTKRDLFHACTDVITRFEGSSDKAARKAIASASISERVHMLFEAMKELEAQFPAEMSLLFDYLRGRNPDEIAKDPSMRLANDRYLALIEQFIGKQQALPVLGLLTGALMQRYFDGQTTSFDHYENWLVTALQAMGET